MTRTPYEMLGDRGVRKLADAFYEAMDNRPEAAEIRAMHAPNLDSIKRKLAAYLTGWMGGPPVYLALEGTVCLRGPHAPYHIGPRQRDQWLLCMDEALERIEASDELKTMLEEPLFRLADTVRNQESSDRKPRDRNLIAAG